ncbi:unnamed protein product [Chironomus riparius]|uniref:Uncharacterized protein n=1 Tax=Chironomus riparius TaxID=315576 RepID=A0A9N9WMT6_9DIPT|nr:unnamed protein product [Chironomus riparius]
MSDPNVIYGGDIEEPVNYATLGEMMVSCFRDGGDKIALINAETDEKWTFNKLLKESIIMAKALYGAGIRQNEIVGILCDNRHEFASISYGTIFLNAVLAPANYAYTEREVKHTFDTTLPKFVFVSSLAESVVPALKNFKYVEKIILIDGENIDDGKLISLKNFIKKYGNNDFDVEKLVQQPIDLYDQVAVIFMSSGTTGFPKGVQTTHGNLISCVAYNLERVSLTKDLFETKIQFSLAPFFHGMGFIGKLFATTSREITLAFLNKFDPDLYLGTIQKYKIEILTVPPPIVVFLAKSPLFDTYDLSSLKLIICAAAPLSQETETQVKERFNNEIFLIQAYGQSEATLAVLYGQAGTAKPGSVGEIIKGMSVKIIDEQTGVSLGKNKVGELCLKGPFLMKGYINNPRATAETIDTEGWLHTGDLAYYDEDNQFFIVDRLKELIKYKGFQVAPAELEGLLLSNPKIKDAGVIGIPDELAGELPFAFVVKELGVDLTEQDVKDFVAQNASNTKWLRGGVKFVDEIPKNPIGKIMRRDLKDLFKSLKAKL